MVRPHNGDGDTVDIAMLCLREQVAQQLNHFHLVFAASYREGDDAQLGHAFTLLLDLITSLK